MVTRCSGRAAGAEAAGTGLVAYVGDEALHTQPAFIERLAALGDRRRARRRDWHRRRLQDDRPVRGRYRAQRLRPKEVLLDAGAELTQALPGYRGGADGRAKATAAAALLDRWGLTWSDALAIGDGQNDVPMLREAGTSVAMANAKQSVRDAAQFGCAERRRWVGRGDGAVRAVVIF